MLWSEIFVKVYTSIVNTIKIAACYILYTKNFVVLETLVRVSKKMDFDYIFTPAHDILLYYSRNSCVVCDDGFSALIQQNK